MWHADMEHRHQPEMSPTVLYAPYTCITSKLLRLRIYHMNIFTNVIKRECCWILYFFPRSETFDFLSFKHEKFKFWSEVLEVVFDLMGMTGAVWLINDTLTLRNECSTARAEGKVIEIIRMWNVKIVQNVIYGSAVYPQCARQNKWRWAVDVAEVSLVLSSWPERTLTLSSGSFHPLNVSSVHLHLPVTISGSSLIQLWSLVIMNHHHCDCHTHCKKQWAMIGYVGHFCEPSETVSVLENQTLWCA